MRKTCMKKTLLILLGFIAFSVFTTQAQNTPHKMTAAEAAMMPAYLQQVRMQVSTGTTTPPFSAVRAAAEWEELDGLIITWTTHLSILRPIITAAQTETKVYIVCSDSNAVKTNLNANNISLSNLVFVQTGFNSIWSRDYGPWSVYTDDVDSLFLIDWIYNRPRPKDDTISYGIAAATGFPLYETTASPYDLVHTGGNFMCDGLGTGFSSRLILDDNPSKTETQIDSIMLQFMGIDRYIKMNKLPYDQIHHIDMHMKLLDEETLLVGEYPSGVSDGPTIDSNLAYVLTNFNSAFGTPYKVIRIPMPPDAAGLYPSSGGDYRTYTNAVFVNRTIIVPTYDPQYDTTALRIWRESMPGYRVVGINCNQIIPSLGAIHCITKEISSSDPLWIVHQELRDQSGLSTGYTVNATIRHRSGISGATVYYRTDTLLPYSSVAMTAGANPDEWTAVIPAQGGGATVYYYIEGNANSGKTQRRPITAPSGCWNFYIVPIAGINSPGLIHFGLDPVYPNPSRGLAIAPVVTDRSMVMTVTLHNMLGETVQEIFSGTIPAGGKNLLLNTGALAPGIYTLSASSGNASVRQKIIVR